DDLRRYLDDQPIRARRPSWFQRARKWCRRHRVAVTAAVVCLVVTLTALVGSIGWVLGDRTSRQRQAEGKVREALEAAAPRVQEGNPHDPLLNEALLRAEAQLGELVGPELRRQVGQLRQDRQTLMQLEQARMQVAASSRRHANHDGFGKDTNFDYDG